jgi:DNA-binding NtrC family response regulator
MGPVSMPTETIAVLNDNEDTIAILVDALRRANYPVVSGRIPRDEESLSDFLGKHDPRIVIYDIPIPYDANWERFAWLQSRGLFAGRAMIVTTTHKGHLDAVATGDSGAIEIVGKPYDLAQILSAVKRRIGEAGSPA